ncbi:DUF2332 domain-containing protein [Microbacterium sp. NPDC055910]|uniref:DUF2332 domain-containing protein n=1 Tax=Microbacterium sp. NPDC055910 TaxID=3345659 RepID=UPI0035DE6383
MHPDAAATADRYARFAVTEARGRSALYEDWAAGVAGDAPTAAILARIPETRRQPPLVFAVARMLGAPEKPFAEWSAWVAEHADDLVAEASRRRLQTNEPLRCAALLPALSTIDGPIALVEVGASAGLCLYPDRYSYRYDGGPDLDPSEGESAVVLASALNGGPPLRLPEIVWRAGIDLDPKDAAHPADRRFLTALVWPGETGRAERITAALDIVAADPPLLVRGDATEPGVLEGVVRRAPEGARVVVTTPGVLPHIPRRGLDRLIEIVQRLEAVWVTIDPPGLHDAWHPPIDPATWGGFVLGRDGVPLAAVDPLGRSVEWRAGAAAPAR